MALTARTVEKAYQKVADKLGEKLNQSNAITLEASNLQLLRGVNVPASEWMRWRAGIEAQARASKPESHTEMVRVAMTVEAMSWNATFKSYAVPVERVDTIILYFLKYLRREICTEVQGSYNITGKQYYGVRY